jgi:hypothetical protein
MLCAGVTVARAVGLVVGILVLHSGVPLSLALMFCLQHSAKLGDARTPLCYFRFVTLLMLCAGAGVSFVVLRLLYSVRLLLLVLD